MLKKMILVRGVPGSGKSYIARQYKDKYKDSCYVCATDEYWMRPDGKYDFNMDLIGNGHVWNQTRVRNIAKSASGIWDTVIVVDNTNITFAEMKPYIKIALDNGFSVEFKEPDTKWKMNVEECYKRNTHGVPYATILRMYHEWETLTIVEFKLKEMLK